MSTLPEPFEFVRHDREWAIDVAAHVARIGAATDSAPLLDDVWVDDELTLCIRYRIGDHLLALRYADLDVDPTSGARPRDSATLASDLVHNLHAADDERPFVDPGGYRWWGSPPAGGWGVPISRIATLVP